MADEDYEPPLAVNSKQSLADKLKDLNTSRLFAGLVCTALLCYVTIYINIWFGIVSLIAIAIIVFCIWFGGTNLSVEITVWLAKFFPASERAVWDTGSLIWAKRFRDNYETIYKEYLEFEKMYGWCPQMDDVYPNGSITNWDKKWPTVTLRCYGLNSGAAKFFPKTMEILNKSEIWLTHAMFSILEPNKFIPRHRGPYRGVFRYQLALEVPKYNKKDRLYLAVWDETSSHEFWHPDNVPHGTPQLLGWKPGHDFLFDDTCVHEVLNNTPDRRIILFVDAERTDISFLSRLLHRLFMTVARFLPVIKQAVAVQDKFLLNPAASSAQPKTDIGCGAAHNHRWGSTLAAPRIPELMHFRLARKIVGTIDSDQNDESRQMGGYASIRETLAETTDASADGMSNMSGIISDGLRQRTNLNSELPSVSE